MNKFKLPKVLAGALLVAGVVGVGSGCVADRPSRNGVFNENQYIRKDFLIEGTDPDGASPGNDPGWMMRATVTETSSPNFLGAATALFSGSQSTIQMVRWRVTSDKLQMLAMQQFSAPQNPDPTNGSEATGPSNETGVTDNIINAWPATNVDLKYRVNLDGEKTNYYEENQELDWQVRQWVKLTFDKNDFSDLAPLDANTQNIVNNCVDTVDASATLVTNSFNVEQGADPSSDYFEFTVQVSMPLTPGAPNDPTCNAIYAATGFPSVIGTDQAGSQVSVTDLTVNLKYSFERAKPLVATYKGQPTVTYQPFPLDEKDPIHTKYGPFQWTAFNYDNATQLMAANTYVGRFDPQKPIVWYFDPTFPEYYKPVFVGGKDAAGNDNPGIMQATNAVLAASGAPTRVQFLNYNDLNKYQDAQGPSRSFGDIRYNFFRWVSDQFLQGVFAGVTMPGYDPRTGEIINEGIEYNDFAVLDYYVARIDAFLQSVGASGGLGTSNWPSGKCAAGQTTQLLSQTALANRNAADTLYTKMQTYLNLNPTQPGTLGPSDFTAVQDQDFFQAYFQLVPFELFADPDANLFVTREGGQGVYGPAAIWADWGQEAQFQQLAATISNGGTPYDTTAGTGAAAAFATTMRNATLGHKALQLAYSLNYNTRDVPGAFSIENVMQQDAQQCINGTWETQAQWKQHIIDTYWQQVFWHEFGHSMGLEHNFAGNVDQLNFAAQRDANGKALTDASGQLYQMYSSSIMEYSAEPARLAWNQGWGKYDQGAIAWIYANCPAKGAACKQADDPTKDAAAATAKSRSGEVIGSAPGKEYPYADPLGFCSASDPDCCAANDSTCTSVAVGQQRQFLFCDEVHMKYSPLCRQGDLGVTPSQIIANNIDSYEWQYQYRNFRDYRKTWNESTYATQVEGFITDQKRFLSEWAFDWGPNDLTNVLYRIGVQPPKGIPAADYYAQLTQKFLTEMSKTNQMVAAFDEAIIAQTAGQRPYATVYDTFYGDVTQQGIILDKYYAMQDFVSLWQSDNYDQNQAGAYISSWGDYDFDSTYQGIAETAIDFMLGGQYSVYPYFAPTAVALFAQDTHNPAYLSGNGRVAAKDWIGGWTVDSQQELVWLFQTLAQNAGVCNTFGSGKTGTGAQIPGAVSCASLDVTDPTTNPQDSSDGHFTWVDGLDYVYAYIQSQNVWVVARRDRNIVTWHNIIAFNTDVIGQHDDGSNGTYALQYQVLYTVDAYNYFEQGGSATTTSSSSSSSSSSN